MIRENTQDFCQIVFYKSQAFGKMWDIAFEIIGIEFLAMWTMEMVR